MVTCSDDILLKFAVVSAAALLIIPFLRPRRKTLCHNHVEQILNTSNAEILHHLVLAT